MTEYTRTIARATAKIARKGFSVTITPKTPTTRVTAGNYTDGADENIPAKILYKRENVQSRRNVRVEKEGVSLEGTRLALMAPTFKGDLSEYLPEPGDTVTVVSSSKTGIIRAVDVVAPGDENVLWYLWIEE